jgi:hypothetical protein
MSRFRASLPRALAVATSLIAGLFGSATASAVDCTGSVSTLSLQLDTLGTVTVSLSNGPSFTYLCAVDGVRNAVSPTVCRTMYATLVAAKTTGKSVLIRFHDHGTCTAVPAWADAGALGWTMVLLD